MNDERVTDRGIPSLGGKPIVDQRDRFFRVPGINYTTLEAHIGKLRLEGQLAPDLTWSSTILFGDFDKVYSNVFANGSASATRGSVPLSGYIDPTTRQNLVAQTNLIWSGVTGGIEHKILAGLEYGDQRSNNLRRDAILSSGVISRVDPVFPIVTFAGTASRDASPARMRLGDRQPLFHHLVIARLMRAPHIQRGRVSNGLDGPWTLPSYTPPACPSLAQRDAAHCPCLRRTDRVRTCLGMAADGKKGASARWRLLRGNGLGWRREAPGILSVHASGSARDDHSHSRPRPAGEDSSRIAPCLAGTRKSHKPLTPVAAGAD